MPGWRAISAVGHFFVLFEGADGDSVVVVVGEGDLRDVWCRLGDNKSVFP